MAHRETFVVLANLGDMSTIGVRISIVLRLIRVEVHVVGVEHLHLGLA